MNETEELIELLKDKDVTLGDLLIRVYDTKSGKEGWISFAQLIRLLLEENTKQRIKEK